MDGAYLFRSTAPAIRSSPALRPGLHHRIPDEDASKISAKSPCCPRLRVEWGPLALRAALSWRIVSARYKYMAFCTKCGATVVGAFCSQCGAPSAQAAQAPVPAPARRGTSPIVWVLVILGSL